MSAKNSVAEDCGAPRKKEDGRTYSKFFSGISAFKKNWLKQARRKRMGSELPSSIFK